ncbi:MAG TPA: dTDP-4-dehydrorhamnose 3,5-epimerase, partial [Sphingomicrobium sp.]|nr:dTDP-4-dehydrorhamnose 3,5-epimerase [Sphingomicrobium sp.]
MLDVRPTALAGVLEIRPRVIADDRGFFSEVWSEAAFAAAGIGLNFVQDNHSLSRDAGVLRGLHFQAPPCAQDKLVRVSRGAVFDVAVDIRPSSLTYRQWVGVTLTAAEWNQLLIPKGFAHGFLALEPDSEVLYKVSAPYSREHDRAIRFDDPAIGIAWPIDRAAVILSDRDRAA